MAISVTRDVISYCVKQGSPIFACSLGVIPHLVLFENCIDILPDIDDVYYNIILVLKSHYPDSME